MQTPLTDKPDFPPGPGYWMHETSGAVAQAVRAYIAGGELLIVDRVVLRQYLQQWIDWPGWAGDLGELRATVRTLSDRISFAQWLYEASLANIDPL